MCERCDAHNALKTYSKKYKWHQEVATFIDIRFFQMRLMAAALEHNKKMDKHNEHTTTT